ncbi:MAG: hypothetical protein ABI781_05275 [Burkholderiales bacterium]
MTRPTTLIAALAAACSAACSPTLDWREFVPEGTDISISFPCRPDRHARAVIVVGAKAQMEMLSCSAGDATFALAFVDVTDPARVGATLAELRATAASNLQASPQNAPLQIRGMTPNEQAARVTLAGKLPDGAAVQEHAAFFTRGLRVYQATVIGAKPLPQVVDTFLGGLKFPG